MYVITLSHPLLLVTNCEGGNKAGRKLGKFEVLSNRARALHYKMQSFKSSIKKDHLTHLQRVHLYVFSNL